MLANNFFIEEAGHNRGSLVGDGLSFYPFGVIVCCHNDILVATCSKGELEKVNPNSVKGFFYWDRVQGFFGVRALLFLADGAVLVVSPDIFKHLRPVVSLLGLVERAVYAHVSRGGVIMKSLEQGGYFIFLNDLERAVWIGLVLLVQGVFNHLELPGFTLDPSLSFLIKGRRIGKGGKI